MTKNAINLCLLFVLFCGTLQAQEQIIIASPYLKTNDTILVFKPTGHQPDKTYPTLFLLHGWSGDYSNWSSRVPLQNFCDKFGFIIVCPDGFYNSWYMDSSYPEGMQWRQFFDKELYPTIQERYAARPDSCFITGLSMGGQGALNIFIDNPSRFRSAGSMSGVMDLRQTGLGSTQVSKVLGPFTYENPRFYTESVINRIELLKQEEDSLAQVHENSETSQTQLDARAREEAKLEREKVIIISCGYQDIYHADSENLSHKCRKLKIPHISLFTPGVHNWTYWEFALDMHLTLFSKILKGENLGY